MTIPTLPQSVKKKDAGRIGGPADVPQVTEIKFQVQLAVGRLTFGLFDGYNTSVAVTQTLANSLFSSLSSAWGTNLGLYMAPTTLFQNVAIRDMTSHTNPVFIGTGTAVAGTSASPAMPFSAAIAMTENINARGRGLKGRVYLGGWSTNADAGGGAIATAVQTAINAFGTAVFNAIQTAGLAPAVAQPARAEYLGVTGTHHPARAAGHVLVSSYVCRDLTWDTQRRRTQA